jgi:hypothetical protein
MNALQNMWHLALYFGGLPLGGLLFPALVVYAFTLGDYEPHGGLCGEGQSRPDTGRRLD